MFPKVLERNFDWHTELIPNKRENVEKERETLVTQTECQQNENN